MNLPDQKIKLLVDNRLIGSHVYRRGEVVQVSGERAKEFVKGKAGIITDEPPTSVPKPAKSRSEIIAEQALNPAPARAEHGIRQPGRPA
jgi:hypothetical protein